MSERCAYQYDADCDHDLADSQCERECRYVETGYCAMHYVRSRKGADMNAMPRGGWERCRHTWGGKYKTGERCTLHKGGKDRLKLGWCSMHYQRHQTGRDMDTPPWTTPEGLRHPYGGGYHAAHKRVEAQRGKARHYECACGAVARQWAFNGDPQAERWGDTPRGDKLAYSPDPSDYDPMCVPCHRKHDRELAIERALRKRLGEAYDRIAG